MPRKQHSPDEIIAKLREADVSSELLHTSNATWYHGSPLELTYVRKGSTITQDRELARVFSHKPTIVCTLDDGRIKHTGTEPGLLYVIDEEVRTEDVVPHPRTTMDPGVEWLTTRDLKLCLLCPTEPVQEELLSDDELRELRARN
jgi:hypothetical protein